MPRTKTSSAVIDWLLEPENPSVRYLTLTRILGESESSRDAVRTRNDIMRIGAVPQILERQREGRWNEPGRFYRAKYTGTVWQLIILAEHLADGYPADGYPADGYPADGIHPQIRDACEYILSCSQDRASGGFSYDESAKEGGGLHSGVVPCLTGNMVFSMLRLGYGGDARVLAGIDWITKYQRFDDGTEQAPTGWPYDRYRMCWGTHVCHMGAVKALKALAAIPRERRTPPVEKTIHAGAEYLLAHHIFRRSHNLDEIARPGWLRLQFPLMYQTDILEVVSILLELGYRDDRMAEAIEKIASKRGADGRWRLEATFNGRYQVDIEKKGKPSKWITLRALDVLKAYCG